MYYSTEKCLRTDLAFPLISAIRPVIDVEENNYNVIIEKALPSLVSNVKPEKLLSALRKKFTKIDSGEVCPSTFVGHELTTDEIVEQVRMHDTFNVFYRDFFRELAIQQPEVVEPVRAYVVETIEGLNRHFNVREMKMLRNMFSSAHGRYPLSMDLNVMVETVDTMHEVTEIVSGKAIADKVLSKAMVDTAKTIEKFDTKFFL